MSKRPQISQDSVPHKRPLHIPRPYSAKARRDLYAEEWGLTIEHELPAHFLFSTQYLGSRAVRLFSRGGVNLCSTPVTLNAGGTDCMRPLGFLLSSRSKCARLDDLRPFWFSRHKKRYRLQYLSRSRRFA